jgi:hypothetical protein
MFSRRSSPPQRSVVIAASSDPRLVIAPTATEFRGDRVTPRDAGGHPMTKRRWWVIECPERPLS